MGADNSTACLVLHEVRRTITIWTTNINGMPYLNFLCIVLWCHTFMPSQAPMLPPSTAKPKRDASRMRQSDFFAFHLSMPYVRNVATLMTTRYTITISFIVIIFFLNYPLEPSARIRSSIHDAPGRGTFGG